MKASNGCLLVHIRDYWVVFLDARGMVQFGKEGDGTASTKCDGLSHHFFNDRMLELLSIRNGVLTPLRRLSGSALASLGFFRDTANERPGGGAGE